MGISIWQLLIILLIIVLLFGSKKIRSLGGDLGSAMRGFKKEMGEEKNEKPEVPPSQANLKEDADFDKQPQQREKQEQNKRD